MADNKLSAQVTIDTKQAVTSLAGLNKSVKGSAEVLAKLKPSAVSGGAALTSLSRIAQDAPFGFIAIQNNVTEAVASFGQLRASTGSTGLALKALGASMLGPGGLLLGFSLITSGVTALIQKYGSLGNAYDALLGKTTVLTEEQKAFAKAQHDSQVDVEKQRVNLEALVKVAQGDVGTKKQQIAALAELNKLIPDNIGFLTEQNIKTEAGTAILRKYTSALIDQAEAELLVGKAAELRVKLREQGKTLNEKVTQDLQKAVKAQQQLGAGASVAGALSGVNAITKAVKINRDAVINGNEAFQDYVKTANELAELTNRIATLTAGSIELTIPDVKINKEKQKKFIVTAISTFVSELKLNDIKLPTLPTVTIDVPFEFNVPDKNQDSFAVARQAIEGFVEQLKQDAKVASVNLGNVLDKEIARGLKGIQSLIKSYTDNGLEPDAFVTAEAVAKVQERLKAIADAFITLQTNIRAILSTFTADAFAGIGEVIGAGLAEGADGIKKAALGLGSLIGGLFVNLGKEMIKASALMIALKAALKSFSGPASLAAGIALVALGSALKAKLGNIGATAFATGGIVTGPTLGMVGEAGQPEVILPLNKINQFLDGGGQGNGGALTLAVSGDVFTFGLARNARKQSRLY